MHDTRYTAHGYTDTRYTDWKHEYTDTQIRRYADTQIGTQPPRASISLTSTLDPQLDARYFITFKTIEVHRRRRRRRVARCGCGCGPASTHRDDPSPPQVCNSILSISSSSVVVNRRYFNRQSSILIVNHHPDPSPWCPPHPGAPEPGFAQPGAEAATCALRTAGPDACLVLLYCSYWPLATYS